jgi:hypothetical protein
VAHQGILPPKYGCKKKIYIYICGPIDANISVVRGQHGMKSKRRASQSLSSDSEKCEDSIILETDEEMSDNDSDCIYCILQTDAGKSGGNALTGTSGALKSVEC